MPDDFDDPLPPDLLALFYEGTLNLLLDTGALLWLLEHDTRLRPAALQLLNDPLNELFVSAVTA